MEVGCTTGLIHPDDIVVITAGIPLGASGHNEHAESADGAMSPLRFSHRRGSGYGLRAHSPTGVRAGLRRAGQQEFEAADSPGQILPCAADGRGTALWTMVACKGRRRTIKSGALRLPLPEGRERLPTVTALVRRAVEQARTVCRWTRGWRLWALVSRWGFSL